MACDFEFPNTFPGGCVSEVITGLRSGTLLDNPRQAIKPVMAVINYGIGMFADDGPPLIGATQPIETESDLANALEAAAEQHTQKNADNAVAAFPIPWVILTPILVKLVEKLLERIANK